MASNQAAEPLCLRPSVLLSERLYLNLGDSDVTTNNQGGFGAGHRGNHTFRHFKFQEILIGSESDVVGAFTAVADKWSTPPAIAEAERLRSLVMSECEANGFSGFENHLREVEFGCRQIPP